MTIELLSDKDKELYNKFIQENKAGSLFQSLAWQQYTETAFHLKSFIVLGKENNVIKNSALVFQYPLPLKKSYLYAPRGPVFSEKTEENDQMLQAIAEEAKKRKAIFFRFDPLLPVSQKLQDLLSIHPVRKTKSNQPKSTLLLDLTKTEEQLLTTMKEKGRYNIRLAAKKGVNVRPGTITELYPLLASTGKRDGFHIHPQKVYETMTEVFGKNVLLLVAEYENEIIAGGIFLFHQETAIYYYGASSNQHRNVMAPYLVQWTAIQEAKKRGCTTYDFLGIAEEGVKNHSWAGVTEFKLKFGGQRQEYIGAFEIRYDKPWSTLYRLYKRVKK